MASPSSGPPRSPLDKEFLLSHELPVAVNMSQHRLLKRAEPLFQPEQLQQQLQHAYFLWLHRVRREGGRSCSVTSSSLTRCTCHVCTCTQGMLIIEAAFLLSLSAVLLNTFRPFNPSVFFSSSLFCLSSRPNLDSGSSSGSGGGHDDDDNNNNSGSSSGRGGCEFGANK